MEKIIGFKTHWANTLEATSWYSIAIKLIEGFYVISIWKNMFMCFVYIYVRYFRMYLAGILNFDLENKAKIHNMLMCLFYNKFFQGRKQRKVYFIFWCNKHKWRCFYSNWLKLRKQILMNSFFLSLVVFYCCNMKKYKTWNNGIIEKQRNKK